jgi:diadenosine tetraphosphatase ApaH/serine/threonine PP2A family protein phosphatase
MKRLMNYERYIIVGDVHGCLDELDELLLLVNYKGCSRGDRLVLAGDLLDRGPDPVGVVRRARELQAEAVLGNHEEKHLRWRKWSNKVAAGESAKNPMRPFDETRLAEHLSLSDDDMDWLEALPPFLRLDESWMVVHAGFETNGVAPEDQKLGKICRVRDVGDDGKMAADHRNPLKPVEGAVPWATRWKGPESVVYGHAVHSLLEPRTDHHDGYSCYGIDTGCVFGGRLTAILVYLDPASVHFYSVNARETYWDAPKEWKIGQSLT